MSNFHFVSLSSKKDFSIDFFSDKEVKIMSTRPIVTLFNMEQEIAKNISMATNLNIVHYQGLDNDIVFHFSHENRLISLFIDSDEEGYIADSATASVTEYLPKKEAIENYIKLLKDF